jgi:hypothetical protein
VRNGGFFECDIFNSFYFLRRFVFYGFVFSLFLFFKSVFSKFLLKACVYKPFLISSGSLFIKSSVVYFLEDFYFGGKKCFFKDYIFRNLSFFSIPKALILGFSFRYGRFFSKLFYLTHRFWNRWKHSQQFFYDMFARFKFLKFRESVFATYNWTGFWTFFYRVWAFQYKKSSSDVFLTVLDVNFLNSLNFHLNKSPFYEGYNLSSVSIFGCVNPSLSILRYLPYVFFISRFFNGPWFFRFFLASNRIKYFVKSLKSKFLISFFDLCLSLFVFGHVSNRMFFFRISIFTELFDLKFNSVSLLKKAFFFCFKIGLANLRKLLAVKKERFFFKSLRRNNVLPTALKRNFITIVVHRRFASWKFKAKGLPLPKGSFFIR